MAAALVGKTINNYQVEDLIASGGMAQVYRARDVELDRLVAIKLIGIDTRREPVFAERLEREARTVAQLRHPNIVGIYHKGVFDDFTYLVIEYVNGPTLSQIIRMVFKQGGRMDYRALLTITSSVTSALDYAHARGVIHRDIKPSNIMSDRNGNVFLTDFGLALRMVDGTEGKAFGSPYYIAPEQVNNSADASPRSDLYSLGVVIFRLLTGRLPFESRKPMHVVMMHISEPAPPVTEYNAALPKAVDSVLLKCLAKRPEERYRSGAELQRALAKSLGLDDMAEPIYQPRFLASTWTRILDKDNEPTYASATHLLDDVQAGALNQEVPNDEWTDVEEGAPLDD